MGFYSQKSESTFTPAPAGVHKGVCVDVIDKGLITGKYGAYHAGQFVFMIEEKNPDFEDHYTVYQNFSVMLTPKSNTTKFLGSWRGKPLTDTDLEGFDFESVLGAKALLNIVHRKDGDKTYANIDSIMPCKEKVAVDFSKYVRHLHKEEGSRDARNPRSENYQGQSSMSDSEPPQNGQEEQAEYVDDDLPF